MVYLLLHEINGNTYDVIIFLGIRVAKVIVTLKESIKCHKHIFAYKNIFRTVTALQIGIKFFKSESCFAL